MRGAIPLLPQYIFMAWYLVKHKDRFTISIPLYRAKKVPRICTVTLRHKREKPRRMQLLRHSDVFRGNLWNFHQLFKRYITVLTFRPTSCLLLSSGSRYLLTSVFPCWADCTEINGGWSRWEGKLRPNTLRDLRRSCRGIFCVRKIKIVLVLTHHAMKMHRAVR